MESKAFLVLWFIVLNVGTQLSICKLEYHHIRKYLLLNECAVYPIWWENLSCLLFSQQSWQYEIVYVFPFQILFRPITWWYLWNFSWTCDSCKSIGELLRKMISYGNKSDETAKISSSGQSRASNILLPSGSATFTTRTTTSMKDEHFKK